MSVTHPYAEEFTKLLIHTQQAYQYRQLEEYLAAFSSDYHGVQLQGSLDEDKTQLKAKISRDFQRYELRSMQFQLLHQWFIGESAYAHLAYRTQLHDRGQNILLYDTRENLVVCRHQGNGHWEITSKVALNSQISTNQASNVSRDDQH